MKEGWEYRKFDDALEKVKYTRKLQTNEFLPKGTFPIISQEEEFISGYWNNKEDLFKVNKPIVIFGDHSRVLKYIDFDFVLGADGVKILEPIDTINAKFLYHFLKWFNVPNMGYSRHYKFLKEINLPIPPLKEQILIVDELDLLSGIIEKENAQLEELDKLAQSIFYDMFGDPVTNEKGWEMADLNSACDVRDGTHDSPKYLPKSDYLLVTSKNIQDDCIDFTTANFISHEDYDNINKRSFVDDGDIIMAMIGTIGKPIIVRKQGYKFCVKNVALIKFNSDSKVLNIFIKSLLNNKSYMHYLKSFNKGGTQKFVALGTIRSLRIPIPPLSLQQEFADKISAIEAMKAKVRQSLKEAEQLFNSRMDYYFN